MTRKRLTQPAGGDTRRAVKQLTGLEVGSVKVTSSRPGRAAGWYPIPPTSPTREKHRRDAARRVTRAFGRHFCITAEAMQFTRSLYSLVRYHTVRVEESYVS
jgi:hypothetical protein